MEPDGYRVKANACDAITALDTMQELHREELLKVGANYSSTPAAYTLLVAGAEKVL